MYLENIHTPRDLTRLNESELNELATEIRAAILKKVSSCGGHLASNLGIVEATLALHTVFSSPHDKLIFDVSHQTYAHKMLTGRKDAFLETEHFGDVSGFMSVAESDHDPFTIGHTSTSISLACGMALGRNASCEKYHIVAVIGDGALSGGEALEGLNFGATLNSPFIVVVNDNNQSIASNIGSLYTNLQELRETNGKSKHNFFELLGYQYLFVKDGHNIAALIESFEKAKQATRPIVVHIVTKKGHGLPAATKKPELFHSVKPFSLNKPDDCEYAVDAFGTYFADLALAQMQIDHNFFVITSATPLPLGFTPKKRELAGTQFIDVGIAEQSAVAITAGLAKSKARAVYGVQSTFLQRAYDQLAQELALDSLPATLVVFNASIYATHDKTHQGKLDIPILSNIPNFVYLAPATMEQFKSAFTWANKQTKHPVAIKMPGIWIETKKSFVWDWDRLNKYQVVKRGTKVALLGLGTFFSLAEKVTDVLATQNIQASLINPLYASGVDENLLDELAQNTDLFVTLEDGIVEGGWGQKVAVYLAKQHKQCLTFGLTKKYRDRYVIEDELEREGLTIPHVLRAIKDALL